MTSLSARPSNYNQSRDPNTAAMMSLILPGLGQIYNNEKRKGILFICVALLNFTLLLAMIFNLPILDALLAFGSQFHMKPNKMLLIVLKEAYLGSSVSFILLGFFLSYIFYAVRDAYDHAAMKKRRIYPDFVIELPEATSGSYIFHFSIMVALFIIAFFFIIPPMPKSQLTEIEFVDQQPPVVHHHREQRHAPKSSVNAGKHENKPVQAPHPTAAHKAEAAKASQSHAPAQPKAAQQHAAAQPKAPSPAPPTPHAAPPAPHAAPPAPHAAPPTPRPAAPSPNPVPRPMPMAHTPSATPSPSAAAIPRMPTASSPSAMPRMAPSAMSMPTATPMPMAAGARSFAPSAMPSMSPSALPRAGSGSGMPTPMARPNGGGGFAGLPTLAPSTIAMGSGGGPGGGTSNFAPLARSGSSGAGSGSGSPSAPGPMHAGGGGGRPGGSSGGPVPVAMGGGPGGGSHGGGPSSGGGPAPVRAGGHGNGGGGGGWSSGPISITPSVPKGGGPGGDGATGNPEANNNPGGKPSVAAQADVDFGPYMADLQRRIKRAWFPPHGQESRRVQVIFKVHSQGELSDLRIEKTSGVAIADQAALQAVQNAAPFRPLPAGAPSVVDIQFTFDYNVFAGGRSF